MATKDRTSLKNDFANGKYATGEKFADLIDSMKVVQLPVVDPQALGTSLSFIDSISQDADGKITATKKTLDLANAHELNPFKGWYKTGDTLPTDGFDGAYLYFKNTSELTGQTTIYRWNGTTYADTGTVVDTSNVQTFETGQAVNETGIGDAVAYNDDDLVQVEGLKKTVEGVADMKPAWTFGLAGNGNPDGTPTLIHSQVVQFEPTAGHKYRLVPNRTSIGTKSITTGYNVFSLAYKPDANSSVVSVFTTLGAGDTTTLQEYYEFTAESALYYSITYRGDNNSPLRVEIFDITEGVKAKKNIIHGSAEEVSDGEIEKTKILAVPGDASDDRVSRYYWTVNRELYAPFEVSIEGILPTGVRTSIATFSELFGTPSTITQPVEYTSWLQKRNVFVSPNSKYVRIVFANATQGTALSSAQVADIDSAGLKIKIKQLGGDEVVLKDTHSKPVMPRTKDSVVFHGVATVEDAFNTVLTKQTFGIGDMDKIHITTVERLRYYTPLERKPTLVTVKGMPSGVRFGIAGAVSVEAIGSTAVNPPQASDAFGVEGSFLVNHEEANYIEINIIKGENAEFTEDVIAEIESSCEVTTEYLSAGENIAKDIVSLNDPQKTGQYLRNLKRPSYSMDGYYTPGITPLVLLHFSDLHSDAVNLRRIAEYANTYSDYIDDVIGTGDIIRDTFDQSFDFWHECGADSFLLSTGNHEYYLRTDTTGHFYENVTPKQVYDKFFAPYRANWGKVVFPTNAATEGQCYYYKDYTAQGIRLIVLDDMANMNPTLRPNTNVQATWLESVLSDAKTNNLHVLCAIHIGTTAETLFTTPFSSLRTILNVDNPDNNRDKEFYSLRDKVEAFISGGGIFIGWIAGHRHIDTIGMITGYNQMSIHVATASGGEYSSSDAGHGNTDANNNGHCWWLVPRGDDCDRTDDTRGQDCFNLISIDPEKMMLRVFKVGSNIDRYGRRKDSLVYNYGTKELLYSDASAE